jgi:hypothetical protein
MKAMTPVRECPALIGSKAENGKSGKYKVNEFYHSKKNRVNQRSS